MGPFTQTAFVLFTTKPQLSEIKAVLAHLPILQTNDTPKDIQNWASKGESLHFAWNAEHKTLIEVDIFDRPYPDEMNKSVDATLLQEYSKGGFGSFILSGALDSAQHFLNLGTDKQYIVDHKAFVRIRVSYNTGTSSPFPPNYDPMIDLSGIIHIVRKLFEVPGALFYFDPTGEVLLPPLDVDELNENYKKGIFPKELWVSFRVFNNSSDTAPHDKIAETLGLVQFGLYDHEVFFDATEIEISYVVTLLRVIVDRELKDGVTYEEGSSLYDIDKRLWTAKLITYRGALFPKKMLRWSREM